MGAPARVPPDADRLTSRYGVETPEHVDLRFELAGFGSRTAAAVLDVLLLSAAGGAGSLVAAGLAATGWAAGIAGRWGTALLVLLLGLGFFLYYILFEGLWNGQTPGKRALGLRVVLDTGHAITISAAIVRNVVRLADMVPVFQGFLFVFLHPSHKRLGDLAAGTIVVRDRPGAWRLAEAEAQEEIADAGPPLLAEAEFALLERYLARLAELAPAARQRFATDLTRRFEDRVPRREADLEAHLVAVFAAEQQRRRGRFARTARPPGAIGRTAVPAAQFVARKREAWEAFRSVALRLGQRGVAALPEAEIPAFAARYREMAADLARARTYGVDTRVVDYLERLTAAGHNALYRGRGRRRPGIRRMLLVECPAAVVSSWRYVLAALLLFTVPGVIGYAMLRERPALADSVVSPVMVNRAQQAADRQARGVGYAQSEEEDLPVIAAAIISNNIVVCFLAFSGGMLAGILTVLSLVYNGLALGTGLGVFANHHAAAYLLTFVAGHGVLELTAIFISGGAGLRLARALVAPGDLSRLDALVLEGRTAVRMVGAVVSLLALAGAIEGLLSASDAGPAWKFGVSGASAVLLGLYLTNGARGLRAVTSDAIPGAPGAATSAYRF